MSENSYEIKPEILKTLGTRVYDHVPPERLPYNPSNPKGDGNIMKNMDPPRQFGFGIELENPGK